MSVKTIKENIYFVGSADPNRKLFDQLIPLPHGTSYNSYLIKGSEKVALIDTVYPPKINEIIQKIKETGTTKIDYIISNHAEQDHSGSIPKLLELFPEAIVVTNPKCKEQLINLLRVDEEKIVEIKDRETLSLGDKTLEFIIAPWVHWPDTMFTYLREDKILFSGDFLGSHLSTQGDFVENEESVYNAAKRYYAEIMMPFRMHIKKHLEKLEAIEIAMVAPSHGPIYQNPELIINAYKDWASDNVKNEAVIVYLSMYDSTLKMVEHLSAQLEKRGVKPRPFSMIDDEIGELAIDIVDAATVIIASPTVLTGPHPNIAYGAYLINALRPKQKFASIIGSFGWGGNMVDQLKGMIPNLKVEFIEPILVKGMPTDEDYKKLDDLAQNISEKHKTIHATV